SFVLLMIINWYLRHYVNGNDAKNRKKKGGSTDKETVEVENQIESPEPAVIRSNDNK
ncbi:8276_t:CDS:1, partial [Scutellospora calospora]